MVEQDIDFSSMSVQQICDYIQSISSKTLNKGADLTKRLIDIAFFDYDAKDKERYMAEKLLETLIPEVEKALSYNQEVLQAYREAIKYHMDTIELHGRGSLAWDIGRPGTTGGEVMRKILNRAAGPLIPNFIKAMGDAWDKLKPDVIKELILDRRRDGEHNAVLILAGLIAGSDEVAWNIMTESERITLMTVSKNYTAARNILVNYGLLPEASNVLPMIPRPKDDVLVSLVMLSSHDKDNISLWTDEALMKHGFNEQQTIFLSISLMALRMKLWIDILADNYGDPVSRTIELQAMENLKETNIQGFKTIFDALRTAEQMGLREGSQNGLDRTLACRVMDFCTSKEMSEDEQMDLWRIVADIYNLERVSCMHYIRFLLRYFSNNVDANSEVLKNDQNYGEIYRIFGTPAGEVEHKSMYEDWIGER